MLGQNFIGPYTQGRAPSVPIQFHTLPSCGLGWGKLAQASCGQQTTLFPVCPTLEPQSIVAHGLTVGQKENLTSQRRQRWNHQKAAEHRILPVDQERDQKAPPPVSRRLLALLTSAGSSRTSRSRKSPKWTSLVLLSWVGNYNIVYSAMYRTVRKD